MARKPSSTTAASKSKSEPAKVSPETPKKASKAPASTEVSESFAEPQAAGGEVHQDRKSVV